MTHPSFDAYIRSDGVTLDAEDVDLLRAIDREGSLNNAATALGRSYAHAQRRIVELERGADGGIGGNVRLLHGTVARPEGGEIY